MRLLGALLLVLVAGPAWAAPAFVQKKLVETNALGATSTTLTFASNITAGSLVVCMAGWSAGGAVTLSSISDGTNTYTTIDTFSTGNSRLVTSYLLNAPAGATTLTFTWTADPVSIRLVCHEASGVATAAALDQHTGQQQTNPGNGTNTISSTAVTTSTAGQYIFGCSFEYPVTGFTPAAGTGFTLREGPAGDAQATEDQVQSAAGSVTATFSPSAGGTSNFLTAIATFKAPATARPCVIGGGIISARCSN